MLKIIEPLNQAIIDGVHYSLLLDLDKANPFLEKTYDYSKFYQGKFRFLNPLTGKLSLNTPEAYGRSMIASLLVKAEPGSSIFDIGAGSLNIQRMLSGAKLLNFYNLDISGPRDNTNVISTMEFGSSKLKKSQKNMTHNLQGDMNKLHRLPFEDSSLDYVVSCMSLHHLNQTKKSQFIVEIFRVLKKGGKLLVVDFCTKTEGGCVTLKGKRGPMECKGYGESIDVLMARLKNAGFTLSDANKNLIDDIIQTNLTQINPNIRFISMNKQ